MDSADHTKPRAAWRLQGRRVLGANGTPRPAALHIKGAVLAEITGVGPDTLDVGDLLVLPGIVDLHGDAFERQLMPRGGVQFPHEVALWDTDRQLVANGITTAYHGLTVSWEPGLRGIEMAAAFVRHLTALRPRLAADTRLHLRFETFALAAADTVAEWLREGAVDLLAFNDHMEFITGRIATKPEAIHKYMGRTALNADAYCELLDQVRARADEVPGMVESLAALARRQGVPMASHDDESPDERRWYDGLGCRICEFPVDEATAREAVRRGNPVVLGAPNVLRGGSHTGRLGASEAVRAGLCTALASDYYYPAPLQAAFRLVRDGICSLPEAWHLVAEGPAQAVGLADRGRIAVGCRADLILVDDSDPLFPRLVATIVAGRPVFSTGGLFSGTLARRTRPAALMHS